MASGRSVQESLCTFGRRRAPGSKRVREARYQGLVLGFPLALDFVASVVAYRYNPFVKMLKGHGPALSAGFLMQKCVSIVTIRHKGEAGCPATIQRKGLLGSP